MLLLLLARLLLACLLLRQGGRLCSREHPAAGRPTRLAQLRQLAEARGFVLGGARRGAQLQSGRRLAAGWGVALQGKGGVQWVSR